MSCQDLVDLRFSTTRTESVKFIDVILEEGVCNYKVCSGTHAESLHLQHFLYHNHVHLAYPGNCLSLYLYDRLYLHIQLIHHLVK